MNKIRAICFSLLILFTPLSAMAADSKKVTYQPDFCEFGITFPSEPYDTERCDPDNVNSCVQQKSYTEVFEFGTTVNFRATCAKSSKAAFQSYTERTTKVLLKAMTKRSVVKSYNTTYRADEDYKQAGLVGEGQSGKSGMLYLAQIWVGKESMMTVEAELIGGENEYADTLFRDVLRSVGYAPKVEDAEPDESESEEKSDQDAAASE